MAETYDVTPELRAVARRAAHRALAGSTQEQVADERQRPHVSVHPQSSGPATLRVPESEGRAPSRAPKPDISGGSSHGFASRSREDRDLVAESLVQAAPRGSELVIPPGSRITPLAKELAFERGVRFVTGRSAEPSGGAPGRPPSFRVAIGSDHGGFALKGELVPLLREMGQRPADLGPSGGDVSVDYPDFAAAVAREVSEGRADLGIVVDGAGIGSAMVACKFPGVLAANCWDERTARNAREHNHANVLTLGSGHLTLAEARAVVAAFLQTPVGSGRHERRASKTRAFEAGNLRPRSLDRTFDEGR